MENDERTAAIARCDGGNDDARRVLTPVRRREDWPRQPEAETEPRSGAESDAAPMSDAEENIPPLRRVCVLDVETTGLDPVRHHVIELCTAVVLVDARGKIVGLPALKWGREDPGYPLPPKITKLTGLTDADLAGRSICRDQLTKFITGCDAVVAFNAAFDRQFMEVFAPGLPMMDWGCAMADVPWRDLGFEPGPQNYLLMQAGKFNPAAHRAADDVLSLIELLDHTCVDGETVMAKVLRAIADPAWRFEATSAPYRFKEDLKDRGYRWRAQGRHGVWHRHVRPGEYVDERAWYHSTIGKPPTIVPLPASERYRGDYRWEPVEPAGGRPAWLR